MKNTFYRMLILALAPVVIGACSESPTSPIKTLEKIDVVIGTGAEALAGKRVTVHYSGWLYDENTADHHGRKFDSSVDRNEPFEFTIGGNVIAGWNQGVVGMKVGGKRTLIIPPELAYGKAGREGIPSNAALIFDIELLGVQ